MPGCQGCGPVLFPPHLEGHRLAANPEIPGVFRRVTPGLSRTARYRRGSRDAGISSPKLSPLDIGKTQKAWIAPGFSQCRREDSNLHSLYGNQVLNLARLPIPPLRRGQLSRGTDAGTNCRLCTGIIRVALSTSRQSTGAGTPRFLANAAERLPLDRSRVLGNAATSLDASTGLERGYRLGYGCFGGWAA